MAEKNHDSWYTILGINPALLSLSLEVRSYWWRKLWVIITHAQVCSFLRSLRGWKIAFSLPFFPPLPHLLVCGSSWSRSCHFGRMKSEVLLARHCRLMFAGFFFQTSITLSSLRKRAENKRASERTDDPTKLEIEKENETHRFKVRPSICLKNEPQGFWPPIQVMPGLDFMKSTILACNCSWSVEAHLRPFIL